jgi:hypothetical protein
MREEVFFQKLFTFTAKTFFHRNEIQICREHGAKNILCGLAHAILIRFCCMQRSKIKQAAFRTVIRHVKNTGGPGWPLRLMQEGQFVL